MSKLLYNTDFETQQDWINFLNASNNEIEYMVIAETEGWVLTKFGIIDKSYEIIGLFDSLREAEKYYNNRAFW